MKNNIIDASSLSSQPSYTFSQDNGNGIKLFQKLYDIQNKNVWTKKNEGGDEFHVIANSTVEGGPGEGGWLCKYETTDAAGKFIQEPIYHNSNDDCKWDTNIGNVNKSPNKDQINRYSDYKLMIELENHVKESLEKFNKNVDDIESYTTSPSPERGGQVKTVGRKRLTKSRVIKKVHKRNTRKIHHLGGADPLRAPVLSVQNITTKINDLNHMYDMNGLMSNFTIFYTSSDINNYNLRSQQFSPNSLWDLLDRQ